MKILLLNYEYPPLGGGAGNATANLAREMAALGHEVRVVTAAYKGLPRLEAVDGYVVRRIAAIRRHADHCSPLEMLSFMVSAFVAVLGEGKRWRPDACLAFFGIPCGPPAWLLRVVHGVPYVISLRGGDVPGFQPYDLAVYHVLTRPLIRFLWHRAAHVVANSRGLAALAANTAGEQPVLIIPNGVDAGRFRPDGDKHLAGPVRLLFVGRVVYQKGLDVLLAALGLLPDPACFTLTVVGEGPARLELVAQVHRLGLTGRVRFLGWQDKQAMPDLYREADVFVFPSRDEGMPNAVLEAMATGLPVAATRISGNEELVVDGETGFLVPPDDAAALATALGRLIADPALRGRLGEAGRKLVLADYSWLRVAERYVRLLGGGG